MGDPLQTKKISALPAAGVLADSDYLPIVQGGVSKKSTVSQVSLYVNGKLPANVLALGQLVGAADQLPYFTGVGVMAKTSLSAYARTILDDANAAAAQATLGIPALLATYGIGVSNAALTVLTSNADWSKPGGWSGFINVAASKLNGVTVPLDIAGANPAFGMWQITGRRDNSGGYTGIFTDYSNGKSWIGSAATSADVPTFRENATAGANTNITSIAGSAAKLTTPRSIGITGDVVGSANFDGSAGISISVSLGTSGVVAGTYGTVTVNTQGRVTVGTVATPVANGGTGGTTASAARTNLGLKAAALSDVLGTVSQSGGTPTGAIVERGSNANGEYVKYADGTMICQLTRTESLAVSAFGPVWAGAASTWTFPVPFVGNVPYVDGKPYISPRLSQSAQNAAPTLTTANFSMIDFGGAGTYNYTIRYIAIGRWF